MTKVEYETVTFLMEDCERLKAENAKLRQALEPFALIGNATDYANLPNRLDVPFAWCEAARRALEVVG